MRILGAIEHPTPLVQPGAMAAVPHPLADSAERTLNKHIRVLPDQWERIEKAAQGTALTANQMVIELAIEALDRRDWPRTEAETRVARASLFAAQVLARGLIADGREHEVQEIRDFISTIVPEAEDDHGPSNSSTHQTESKCIVDLTARATDRSPDDSMVLNDPFH